MNNLALWNDFEVAYIETKNPDLVLIYASGKKDKPKQPYLKLINKAELKNLEEENG